MASLRLYDLEPSGNCYKVRLFCALLGLPLEIVSIDYVGGEHTKPPFLAKNPFAQIPVLEDGEETFRDSQAILVYLARKYGSETWLPLDAAPMAEVMSWLMVAENEIPRGPGDARLFEKFGIKLDVALAREKAAHILKLIETHLSDREWLALGRPTIADIACMPYIGLSHEGGITLAPYPAIQAWIARTKALPGFITMPAL